jgi:hypothetical protein
MSTRYSTTVSSGASTQATVVSSGSTTQVKKVVVGTPVRRVTSGAISVDNLSGINTNGAVNGSLLIYNTSNENWEASLNLEDQNINGGSY